MSRFHPLTVRDVRKTIRDAVVVTLEPEDREAFTFRAGQYLTFRKDFDGEEIRRCYSVCAGEHEGKLQIGVKRVDGGAFSTWANDELRAGDTLEAMPPMGRFTVEDGGDASKHYLAFAGGSGITPVLSILKTVLEREPLSRFTLIYANRAVNTIMFREELEDLKNRHLDRLAVIHMLESGNEDSALLSGRIDPDKCASMFRHLVNLEQVDEALICGPRPMMMTISRSLKEHGLAKERIKFELFEQGQQTKLTRPVARSAEQGDEQEKVKATVVLDGVAHHFEMHRRGQSILEAALENDLDVPFACRAGVCSTCMAKLTEGEVEMLANHALEDHEVERGYRLMCQSHPLSDTVAVSYDQ